MNVIRSRQHNLSTEQVNKIALSANDDKRIIQPGKIQTLAYGFRAWGALGGLKQRGQTGNMRETGKGSSLGPWLGAKESGAKSSISRTNRGGKGADWGPDWGQRKVGQIPQNLSSAMCCLYIAWIQ